mmetsp:Transcript_18976/g.52934  ORF Transcript_18976/g.52934 Transcript_18976/m.52934 type:complete len:238 (-) Transcript_18976:420-1133(-)
MRRRLGKHDAPGCNMDGCRAAQRERVRAKGMPGAGGHSRPGSETLCQWLFGTEITGFDDGRPARSPALFPEPGRKRHRTRIDPRDGQQDGDRDCRLLVPGGTHGGTQRKRVDGRHGILCRPVLSRACGATATATAIATHDCLPISGLPRRLRYSLGVLELHLRAGGGGGGFGCYCCCCCDNKNARSSHHHHHHNNNNNQHDRSVVSAHQCVQSFAGGGNPHPIRGDIGAAQRHELAL